ncbi:MAG TPA: hypothetical protein VLY23_05120 [Candidatus Acidoferrum sp.]|nr:hypothetical protein [Candidatus Acidoferrum sp.]
MKTTERLSHGLFATAAFTLVFTLASILAASVPASPQAKAGSAPSFAPDKGTFDILVNGKPAGKEDFEISPSGGNWIVRGTASIQAANSVTRVTGTLELQPDGTPLHYEWSTEGDKHASSTVTFDGRTASVEPHIPGAYPYSQQFTFNSQPIVVLDNNLYDQYAVLARLYDRSKKGVQTFSVLVPQEITGGPVTVESLGNQDAGGKKLEQLRVKTEGNELNLFLDGQRLMRITVPGANAEIVRE